MANFKINISEQSYKVRGGFTIARGRIDAVPVLEVQIEQGDKIGFGECRPYARNDETIQSVTEQIRSILPEFQSQKDAYEAKSLLQSLLPAGAGRNAIDCSLWDLICKIEGKDIFSLLNISRKESLASLYTISVGTPEKMAEDAKKAVALGAKFLKIKLAGQDDELRLKALRDSVPNVMMMLDMNEAWDKTDFLKNYKMLCDYKISFIEQPFSAKSPTMMQDMPKDIPIFADEAFHTSHELEDIKDFYQGVNIKLDKSGGLTQALLDYDVARDAGLNVMVGCMLASSLAMAPAYVLASKGADYVDLDAPALLEEDKPNAMNYENGFIYAPNTSLWG